jgi:hypothetical protein
MTKLGAQLSTVYASAWQRGERHRSPPGFQIGSGACGGRPHMSRRPVDIWVPLSVKHGTRSRGVPSAAHLGSLKFIHLPGTKSRFQRE